MHLFVNNDLARKYKKQLMYLSHPASIYYLSSRNQIFPYCSKKVAVEIILKSMLTDEKAIIFSQFIDVLHIYFDICNSLGLSAIIITGSDKGKELKEKIHRFKYISQCKVLLTTLQKASEGFNFNFATHVIILEFWWNPQKIFQAMSRIDRKTQSRNIFIYLLCYNKDGEMLPEEINIYNKMDMKVTDAREIYKLISNSNDSLDNKTGTYNRELPSIGYFKDILTFPDELSEFLVTFHITTEKPIVEFKEISAKSIHQVRKEMAMKYSNYSQFIKMPLLYFPWCLSKKNISKYRNIFIRERLEKKTVKKLENDIDNYPTMRFGLPLNISDYYPFVYIKSYKLYLKNNIKLIWLYVVGKRKNGKYDLLHIQFISKNTYDDLFIRLRNIGIKKIDTVILYNNKLKPIGFENIQKKIRCIFQKPNFKCV